VEKIVLKEKLELIALINTRPVGWDLMKQVMNACCCDKSLRNEVHLPVGSD
jgi:hypothetical protein